MSPFKVSRMIKENDKMCMDTLCKQCDTRFRHRYFKMSDELFYCEDCGTNRHYVKKLSFVGWLRIPFCHDEYYTF